MSQYSKAMGFIWLYLLAPTVRHAAASFWSAIKATLGRAWNLAPVGILAFVLYGLFVGVPNPAVHNGFVTTKGIPIRSLTYFKDGASCEAYVSEINPQLAGQAVSVLDPNDSSKAMTITYVASGVALNKPFAPGILFERKWCVKVSDHATSSDLYPSLKFVLQAWGSYSFVVFGLVAAVMVAIFWLLLAFLAAGSVAISGLLRALFIVVRGVWAPRGAHMTWPVNDGSFVPVLVHLSDLHICNSMPYEVQENPELGERLGERGTQERLERVLNALSTSASEFPGLAITGDITDLGSEDEWQLFISTLTRRELPKHLLIVPGNHDLSINVGDKPDHQGTERANRVARFYAACRELSKAGFEVSHPTEAKPCLTVLEPGHRINIIAISSNNYKSKFVLSNSVGLIGQTQIRTVQAMIHKINGPLVVLIHHHLAVRPDESRTLGERLFTCFKIAIDGTRLLRLLWLYANEAESNHVLVLHGHMHAQYELRYTPGLNSGSTPVHIYGSNSSTMGSETNERLDGLESYALIFYSPRWGFRVVHEPASVSATLRQTPPPGRPES